MSVLLAPLMLTYRAARSWFFVCVETEARAACLSAGPLPAWDDRASLSVYVAPQNGDGLCGTVGL